MVVSDARAVPAQVEQDGAPERSRRPRPWDRVSLLWRVFAANTVVIRRRVRAAGVDAGDRPPRRDARRAARPGDRAGGDAARRPGAAAPRVRAAAAARGRDGRGRPGPARPPSRARATSAGREVVALAEALNAMLDRLEGERPRERPPRARRPGGRAQAVARELHDEVGQTLTAIALRAERAARESRGQREALAEIAADGARAASRTCTGSGASCAPRRSTISAWSTR